MNRYLNQASNNVAGVASTGISRSQSMTQGAGQAAMVAIQRHNQQQNASTPRQGPGTKQAARRANSLTAASNRSNSMRSYTYHPKPSYTVGQPIGSSNQGARRFNSLNSKSSVGSYNRHGARAASLTSQNSFVRSRSPPVLYEQDDEGEEEGDITVTTKTTKVVDSQGRVLSITVETIKTFADGSTVTNTTTKNISRSNSRANSLNSQSMALKGNNSIRQNSMLSNGAGGSYNLSKIDEDLQDFDYNYELDHDILTQKGHGHPHVDNLLHELAHDDNFHGQSLRLNQGNHVSSHHAGDFGSPELPSYGNESIHSTGLKSVTSESSKPLKSILKKKNNINDKGPEDEEGFADAADELQTDKQLEIKQLEIKQDDTQHPYKSLSSPQFTEPPKFKVPQSPNMHVSQQSNRINTNAGSKRTHSLMSSPISRQDDALSDRSEASNSIKFLDKHETIPIFYNSDPKETDNSKPSDQDFYSIAMQVAMERVYGNKESEQSESQSPKLGGQKILSSNSHSLPVQDPKKERKTQELYDQGVNDNYVYQNHHKDFVGLSLRDNVEPKQTSRKERAKEEKKQHKSELKEQKQKIKEQEKGEFDASKAASKDQKKAQKAQKHGRFSSLFGRRKSTTNDNSNRAGEEKSHKYSSSDSQPIASINNPVESNTRSADATESQKPNYSNYGKEELIKTAQLKEYEKLNNNSGHDAVSRPDDTFRREERTNMTAFNPEMQRRLMSVSNTEKDRGQVNDNHISNFTGDQNNYYHHDRNLNSNESHDGVKNNSKPDSFPSLGAMADHENSYTNAPSRPVFINEGTSSYSMRFPRNDSVRSDTEKLTNLPHTGDNADLNMSSPQNHITEDTSTGHKEFQDMPGSMPGVDSSVLRAIVKDDTEAGPSFDHDVTDLNQKTTLDPSVNIMNDRSSVYSNDAEEKRKGKVLDPITVPVLNEIKSETTSIESQSNKNTGLDAEFESAENIEPEELLDSDNVVDYSEPAGDVLDEDIEEENAKDSLGNKSDIAAQESNSDGLNDEAVLVNQDDAKGYNNSNALTNDPSLAQEQHPQEQTVTLGNQTNVHLLVADGDNRTLNEALDDREELVHNTELGKFSSQKLDSQVAVDEVTTAMKNVDVFPPFVNNSLDDTNKNLNLSDNKIANNQSQNLQTARPINEELADGGIANITDPNAAKSPTHRDQLQSTSIPKSSFEHMQREESGSPVVVHNDHDISESKPSNKGSKFKQKLFKYFVNSYNN